MACPRVWTLVVDSLTPGPLHLPLLSGEQREMEGEAWRDGKAICPVHRVKGMLAAITSNLWNASS